MKKVAMLMALLLVVGMSPAFALTSGMDEKFTDMAGSDNYLEKTSGMLLHGTTQVLHAPSHLVVEPYHRVVHEKNYVTGLFEGIGYGTVHAVEGIFTGAFNILGSPIPGFYGMA